MTELIPDPDRPGWYIAGPPHPAQARVFRIDTPVIDGWTGKLIGHQQGFTFYDRGNPVKLSEFLGQILSMFESHTQFAAHVDDTVAATSARPIVNAMKANNEALRKMVADAQAEEEPEDTAVEDSIAADPDTDTVDIPPGHDAEVDALRAVADEKGVKYNMRMRAAGLRKALGMTADESVTVDPKQLPDEMSAQVADEMSAQDAADHSADDLNAEEAARHAQG